MATLQDVFTQQQAAAPQQQQQQQQQQQIVPPSSPEQLEQRKGKWGEFLQNLRNDPDVANALLQFGSGVLAGPKRGQSDASLLANNVQNSVRSFQQAKAGRAEAGIAAEDKRLEQTQAQATIDATRGGTAEVNAKTNEVGANAASNRNLQGAQANKATTDSANSTALTPSKIAVNTAEAGKTTSETGVGAANAQTNLLNAKTNKLNVQLDNAIEKAKITQGDRKLNLEAERIAKVYEAAIANGGATKGSADMQMLDHFIVGLHGGDVQAGTKAFLKQKITLARAGAITTADTELNAETSQNLLNSAGFPETNPRQAEAEASAKAALPPNTAHTVVPNEAGGFDVLVDGKLVGTLD